MTITARWADLVPGTFLTQQEHEATIRTADEMAALVATLANADTSEAHLVHHSRPLRTGRFGAGKPDHRFIVAIADGFGYIDYSDPKNWCQLIGDPASPGWHTTSAQDFRPGSGISINAMTDVLVEFLNSGHRPESTRWRDCAAPDSTSAERT